MHGVQIDFDSVKNGIGDIQAKLNIIPQYNDQHPGDKIEVKPTTCNDVVTVSYWTSFSTVATDTSVLHKIIDAARGLIPTFTDFPPTATTVLNGIDLGSAALGRVLNRESAQGDQSVHFTATPCGEPPHYISITAKVAGFWQISDNGDDDETVRLGLTLEAGGKRDHTDLKHNGTESDGGPYDFEQSAQIAIREDSPFTVRVSLTEFCVTDGTIIPTRATVSMIRVDEIEVILKIVDEETYKLINLPKDPGRTNTPEGGKKAKPKDG